MDERKIYDESYFRPRQGRLHSAKLIAVAGGAAVSGSLGAAVSFGNIAMSHINEYFRQQKRRSAGEINPRFPKTRAIPVSAIEGSPDHFGNIDDINQAMRLALPEIPENDFMNIEGSGRSGSFRYHSFKRRRMYGRRKRVFGRRRPAYRARKVYGARRRYRRRRY